MNPPTPPDLEALVRARTQELEARCQSLRRLAMELSLAEQRSRVSLSGALHDGLQQELASAKMNLDLLARDRGDRQVLMDRLRKALNSAITEARSLSIELSPPLLNQFGLAAGLEWLGDWAKEKHGLEVSLELDASVNPSSEDVRALLFAATRELLLNVARHSGATSVGVELALAGPDRCRVTVSDRGRGIEPKLLSGAPSATDAGRGLFTLRERLALMGGSLELEASEGPGARVTLLAPMKGA